MSRRVFDVGLDVSRIKNGLKVNRDNKRHKTIRAASTPATDDLQDPNQQLAVVPHLHKKESVPNLGALELNHRYDDDVPLPSPKSAEPTMHGGFPIPPSHHSSPVNGEFSFKDSHATQRLSSSGPSQNFDLRPPPPNKPVKFLDTCSEDLFSGDHLKAILRDPSFFLRFTAFLNRYKPQSAPFLIQYLETQKAIKAIEYANALAHTIKRVPGDFAGETAYPAASIDPGFEASAKETFGKLVAEALPAYVTHCLVKVVTESMVREITGTTMPIMRELVGGLAEVFCLSDPSLPENPIVYASEEFYHTSQYGRDYTIGKNCRFLQGPKTDKQCIARLSAAIKAGQEICETILNYRRDGSPFMNLLMIAPLYDNRGIIRYFIGAQVDVSGLIEEGRGLDSFARCIEDRALSRQRENEAAQETAPKRLLRTLNEFGQLLSPDESSLFQPRSRPSSIQSKGNHSTTNHSMRSASTTRDTYIRRARKVLGNEDQDHEEERSGWPFSSMGPSGKLPGVYQNYLLVRPYPSLRIVFVSAALRIPGLLQTPFLSRIGGPSHVRNGLVDSFKSGSPVTARILWLPQGHLDDDGDSQRSRPGSRRTPGDANPYSVINPSDGGSRTRYISCTPLLGSDDQVGVWMVVMVENEQVTGSLVSREAAFKKYNEVPPTQSEYERESGESKRRVNGVNGDEEQMKMYGDYLKSQGRRTLSADSNINGGERDGLMDGILGALEDRSMRL